jgi:hypothetical protein
MTTSPQIPHRGTKDFTKYAISVMVAYDQGKVVEFSNKNRNDYGTITNPAWDWGGCDYRIKPNPTVIPWTMETAPVGKIVRRNAVRYIIMKADATFASVAHYLELPYEVLLKEWTMDDGSPCGTVQQ